MERGGLQVRSTAGGRHRAERPGETGAASPPVNRSYGDWKFLMTRVLGPSILVICFMVVMLHSLMSLPRDTYSDLPSPLVRKMSDGILKVVSNNNSTFRSSDSLHQDKSPSYLADTLESFKKNNPDFLVKSQKSREDFRGLLIRQKVLPLGGEALAELKRKELEEMGKQNEENINQNEENINLLKNEESNQNEEIPLIDEIPEVKIPSKIKYPEVAIPAVGNEQQKVPSREENEEGIVVGNKEDVLEIPENRKVEKPSRNAKKLPMVESLQKEKPVANLSKKAGAKDDKGSVANLSKKAGAKGKKESAANHRNAIAGRRSGDEEMMANQLAALAAAHKDDVQPDILNEEGEEVIPIPQDGDVKNPPGMDTNDKEGDDENPVKENVLPVGPPRGGPVLITMERDEFIYEGKSDEKFHGILGHRVDGTPGWVPKRSKDAGAGKLRGGFNIPVSDSISLDRIIPDTRANECKAMFGSSSTSPLDPYALPEASVIIVFFNEPFSPLVRSVHSVLNRTPPQLLREIVLVDDGSTDDHIRVGGNGKLEEYLSLLPKVRLVRNPVRTGIVGARLLGIQSATADIFVILDSHIEVQNRWLEPLVYRIKDDRRRVVMPQIDSINPRTFEPQAGGIGCTLGFIWSLMEHAYTPTPEVPERYQKSVTDYISSPAMAGGLFAAHKDFFLEIGGYDTGMMYWGVENLELSFRLWQCGGFLECSQCSRVYHIFRQGGHGYSVPPHSLEINKLRVMSIWMDDYADLPWRVLGKPTYPMGDISERVALRDRLQCKPFHYFMTEVWPESDVQNLPEDVPYLGLLENKGAKGYCAIPSGHSPASSSLRVEQCPTEKDTDFASLMYFRKSKRITTVRNDEACLTGATKFDWCRQFMAKNQQWTFEDGRLMTTGLCLTLSPKLTSLTLSKCDPLNGLQLWTWEQYEPMHPWNPYKYVEAEI